jgi:DNA-binding MurR/RpiR family transcriptional regulator
MELFLKINSLGEFTSKKYKALSRYLLSFPDKAPFLTLSELAKETAVSESTIVRFARELGYKGYPELKEEFQNIILKRLAPSERLQKKFPATHNLVEIIDEIYEREIKNIQEAKTKFSISKIQAIASTIVDARHKYVIGLRASAGCAYLLGHLLVQILPNVTTILDGDARLFEGLKSIGEKDVLIAISYPRYTKRIIEAIEFSRNRKAKNIVITDSEISPLSQAEELSIIASSSSLGFANSYTACTFAINILTAVIVHLHKDLTKKMLDEWEESTKAIEPELVFRTVR